MHELVFMIRYMSGLIDIALLFYRLYACCLIMCLIDMRAGIMRAGDLSHLI